MKVEIVSYHSKHPVAIVLGDGREHNLRVDTAKKLALGIMQAVLRIEAHQHNCNCIEITPDGVTINGERINA